MKKLKILMLSVCLVVFGISFLPSNSEAAKPNYICGRCPSAFYNYNFAFAHSRDTGHNVYRNNGGVMWCNTPIEI